jgi:hypothetical protein
MKDTEFAKLHQYKVFGRSYTPTNTDAEEFLQEYIHLGFIEHEIITVPDNEITVDYLQEKEAGSTLLYKIISIRDGALHNCYFSLLSYIYDYLPDKFQKVVLKKEFLYFLKQLKKEYRVVYSFKDENKKQQVKEQLINRKKELKLTYKNIEKIAEMLGKSDLIDYISLSYAKMNNEEFKQYIRDTMPFIYTDVIGKFYEGDRLKDIVSTIESEYDRFFVKLDY